ncbi:hypothetical protein B9L19_08320 [Geobacillus thermocatenulatus]|uniref:Uncharacterized protein n=1 Tax=Geobacillus thermocatenulatus TaxID=33938 RepID=A0A226QF37_9BACL|nr:MULTISPECIES: hypothetical protein [Geobacillus]ASS99257.1 hypothetical protein GT3921_09520 [Geobacillus thermocatenulatus]KLR73310.1 hypothetical protein ABH20_11735 [Geobacillus sp. T6]KPD00474.1 hypothetical protein LR69_01358 [Geobacillus sp. BCO2]OXB89989.1 hypothetical protein B9L19_08320 [Geobacillus thermocatenulatus]
MEHNTNLELKVLVETIVRDLLEKANSAQKVHKKVLFIFCDSSAHELFTDQLIQLDNTEIGYDLLFLDGETSAWLGLHQIESTGSTKVIAADELAPAPLELPKEYEAVVIPEIDLDNAARIALGLKGSVKAEIVFSALTLGKPVIIGEDVPGIKRADRRTLKKLSLPPAYQKLFIQYKEDLKNMGVILTKQERIYEAILEKLSGSPTHSSESEDKGKRFEGNVVTADWVHYYLEENDSLIVNKKVLITPQAKDLLNEKRIDVKFV